MACEKGALEGAICARAHMRSKPKGLRVMKVLDRKKKEFVKYLLMYL